MSQDVSDPSVTDLPDGVGDLIAELARERDVSEEELLSRLLGAAADGPDAGDADDGPAELRTDLADVDDRLEGLQDDIADLRGRVDDLDSDFEETVSDVRERVIQVKRETDAKADADHGHTDLTSDIGDAVAEVNALADDADALESRLEDSLSEVTAETESLREEMDAFSADVTHKLDVLGAAVVEMRDQVRTLLAERQKRAVLEGLQTRANREGVRTANCGSCSKGVDVGLLAEPRCPHCSESFEELDPKDGFFGSNVLKTGRPPALDGDIGATGSDLDDIVEE